MRVNVISIVGSDREKTALARLTKMGFAVDLFPAFDFRERQIAELDGIANLQEFSKRYARLPSAGEIGCSLSHLSLIKSMKMTAGKDYQVIFEDDALPKVSGREFQRICDELSDSPFDVILLGYSKVDEETESYINVVNPFYPLHRVADGSHAVGARYSEGFTGAVGYLVKKSAIVKFARLEKVEHVADDWCFFSSLGLRIGHISPMLVEEDYARTKSTLGHDFVFPIRFHNIIGVKWIRRAMGALRSILLGIRCRVEYGLRRRE